MLTDGTKPTVKGVTSLFLYEKWGICYGLCEESANIIAMSKGDDGTLLFQGVTSLEGFVPGEIAISPDEKMMLVSSPSGSGLVLLQLP